MPVISGGKIIEGGGPQWLSAPAAPSNGTNEAQTITVTADAGTYKIGYEGWYTTALPWNAASAAVQVALRLIPSINGAFVTVTGDAPHTVTFVTDLGKLDVALLTTDVGALINGAAAGTAVAAVSTPGVTATGRGTARGTKYTDTANGIEYVNTSATALAPTWVAVSVASITQEMLDVVAAIPTAAVAAVAGLGITITAANPTAIGAVNPTAVAATDPAVIAGTTPAGGTGATAGGYDTANNRDLFIATVAEIKAQVNVNRTLTLDLKARQGENLTELTDLKARQGENLTELTELKTDIGTLQTTVVEIKARLNDLLVALRTAGIVTP